ncbi:phosphate ABC transporter substrate-binding protein PstS family protein [Bacillus sp. SD088]|uniref:phosphate ABC transporter substrate-binding protein PstS family protein n=1 Tax=Bacillus sp. SD088 TaxID=2782012 RepID=UPI001A96E69A|nr:phosphate ABC transporter substrate-binding protein PstS family protein [Bacillus sp. SD088]MBO0992180.1 phosphate ABC transporter substrate-binding protein PstS family protein [Bacillus sp. SD088]
MNKKWIAYLGCLFMFTMLLAACSNTEAGSESASETSKPSTETSKKTSTESDELTGSITVVGSSAMQPLVEAAAQQFMQQHPEVTVNVQGGGSGTGLSKISEGAVDIGNSDVFAEEKDGIPADKLTDHKVAVVGMAPVVHSEVGVEDVTQDQLIDIFTGKIKNWKELGGADQEIIVVNRAQGSGTRDTFETFALNGEEAIEAQEQDSSGTVRKIVSETPGAISYLAFSYIDDSIQALKMDGAEPTAENVETNRWKVWAYQHMYTNGDAVDVTKQFIDYMLTEEVQTKLLPKMDYLPVTSMKVDRNANGEVSNQ